MRTSGSRSWLLLLALLGVTALVVARPGESPRVPSGIEKGGPGAPGELPPTRLGGGAPRDAGRRASVPVVRGRVIDARDGSPVSGVPVLVGGQPAWAYEPVRYPLLTRSVSGADGTFVVEALPVEADDLRLCLLAFGAGWVAEIPADAGPRGMHPPWSVPRREGFPAAVTLRVVPAARVEGVVRLPDGAPASGATVRPAVPGRPVPPTFFSPWDLRTLAQAQETGADGTFVWDTVPQGQAARFAAFLDGFARALSEPAALRGGATTSLELKFPAPARALLEVLDRGNGVPVEGAVVRVAQRGDVHRGVERQRAYAKTDEAGYAVVGPLPTGRLHVHVEAAGYLPWDSPHDQDAREALLARDADGVRRARITLEAAAWVCGRILVPERLRASCTLVVDLRALDAPGYEGYRADSYALLHDGACTLDRDGTFRMPVPPTGTYRLQVTLDDFEAWEQAAVAVVPGQTGVEIPVGLERRVPPETARAWILDLRGPDGRPVPKAHLKVETATGLDPLGIYEDSPGGHATRQEDGTWRVPVPEAYAPGIWIHIEAETADGARTGPKTFGLFSADGGHRRLDLPTAWSIEGRVLAPDGGPLVGVHVKGWAVIPPDPATGRTCRAGVFANTDVGGRFGLEGLGHDAYGLEVGGEGRWLPPVRRLVPRGTTVVVLRTVAPTSVTLTVLAPDGSPSEGAYVSVRQGSSPRGEDVPGVFCSAVTGPDGRALLERIEVGGTYELQVDGRTGTGRLLVEDWRPRDATLRLDRRSRVTGKVVDAHGAVVLSGTVGLEDAAGKWHTARVVRNGTFAFRDIAPGPARIVATWGRVRPEHLREPHAVDVAAGTTEVELVLPSHRDLEITVTGLRTARPPPLDLRLRRALPDGTYGEVRRAAVERFGRARFRGLDPEAPYVIWGRIPALDRYVLADVPAGATRVSVPLRKGATIEGRLLLPPGARGDAEVGIRVRDHWIRGNVRGDGTFRLRAVPEGEWRVEAHFGEGNRRREAATSARAGGEVTLDLRGP